MKLFIVCKLVSLGVEFALDVEVALDVKVALDVEVELQWVEKRLSSVTLGLEIYISVI